MEGRLFYSLWIAKYQHLRIIQLCYPQIFFLSLIPQIQQQKKITASNLFKGATYSVVLATSTTPNRAGATYICDGTNDDVEFQAATDAVTAAGGGIVFIREGTYTASTAVVPKSNVTYLGVGAPTILKTNFNGQFFLVDATSSATSDIVFDNLTFVGNVTNAPTNPTRARSTSGSGIYNAIKVSGSLDTSASFPVVTNVTIRNCIFKNILELPILTSGISGLTMCYNNNFYNNLDVGFKFSEEVMFNNNHVYGSADNGVSLSRGNRKVTCVGNSIENCCYNGIWVSGFLTDKGPQEFTVVGNTIRNVGFNGIVAQDAPKYGVISGNFINKMFKRGATDQADDLQCNGIMLRGYPVSNPAAASDYAQGILVANNTIWQAPRAGIMYDSAKGCKIDGNLIIDCGTQYLADGTTAIAASNVGNNIGVFCDLPATIQDITVSNNTTIDQRGTAYTNLSVYPIYDSDITYFNNTVFNARNPMSAVSFMRGGEMINRTTLNDVSGTATTGDRLIAFTALTGTKSITLPTPVTGQTQLLSIVDESGAAGTHNISIVGTVNGGTATTINSNYGVKNLYTNGSAWFSI